MRPATLAVLIALAVPALLRSDEEAKDWSHYAGKLAFMVGYDEGLAEAEYTGKPLMAFFTTTWCSPCQRLARESFNDDRVVAALADFLIVIVDGDVEKGACARFGVESYPNVRFLTADETELGAVHDYVPVDKFLEEAKAARGKLDKEIKLTPQYAKLVQAAKDLEAAMRKKDEAAALAAIAVIEQAKHPGPEARAAAQAREALPAARKK